MSHVLQREMEQELELVDNKGGGGLLGKVGLISDYFYLCVTFLGKAVFSFDFK